MTKERAKEIEKILEDKDCRVNYHTNSKNLFIDYSVYNNSYNKDGIIKLVNILNSIKELSESNGSFNVSVSHGYYDDVDDVKLEFILK